MASYAEGPYTIAQGATQQFPASSWPSPDAAGWVVIFNFSTNLLTVNVSGDSAYLAPYVADIYAPEGQAFSISTDTVGGVGEIYLVYYSADSDAPSGYPMALFVAPAGIPPTPTTVTIGGPLPLPVDIAGGLLTILSNPGPPYGTATIGYASVLHAIGGTPPYTWAVIGGSLPVGLSLSGGGHITGTPTVTGGSVFIVQVTDASTSTTSAAFGMVVVPMPGGGTGPWIAGTGAHSAQLDGSSDDAAGVSSVSEGNSTIAHGDHSHAEGATTQAPALNSHAEGQGSTAYLTGQHAHSSGESVPFSQYSRVTAGVITYDANPDVMSGGDGLGYVLKFLNAALGDDWNRSAIIRGHIIARRKNPPGTDSAWEFTGVIRGDGLSAYSWVGGAAPLPTVIIQDGGAATWSVAVAIATNTIVVTVTGRSLYTIDWHLTLELDELN